MAWTLWIGFALAWATAGVFYVLGSVLLARPVASEAARVANVLFAVWWFGLAISNVVSGLRIVLVAFDLPLTLFVGLGFVSNGGVALGLAGLLYYLLYLFSGRSFHLWPLVLFYALFAGWIMRAASEWRPIAVETGRWGASVVYARPLEGLDRVIALLALAGPQLLAVVALLVLAVAVPYSASRFRVLVVAIAIFAWLGSTVLSAAVGGGPVWEFLGEVIPLLAGLAVLAVHRPPAWLRRRIPPELPGPLQRGAT